MVLTLFKNANLALAFLLELGVLLRWGSGILYRVRNNCQSRTRHRPSIGGYSGMGPVWIAESNVASERPLALIPLTNRS